MKNGIVMTLFTLLMVLAMFLLFYFIYDVKPGNMKKNFTYSKKVISNHLMGYAPAAMEEIVADDVTLLYVDITWRELEPKEGIRRLV